jgi:hypothetical protein
MSRALTRRIKALEVAQGSSRPDLAREAMAEALAQLGLSNELEIALAIFSRGFSRPLANIHPNLPALYMRLWMERQGWAYCEGDELL